MVYCKKILFIFLRRSTLYYVNSSRLQYQVAHLQRTLLSLSDKAKLSIFRTLIYYYAYQVWGWSNSSFQFYSSLKIEHCDPRNTKNAIFTQFSVSSVYYLTSWYVFNRPRTWQMWYFVQKKVENKTLNSFFFCWFIRELYTGILGKCQKSTWKM